MGLSCLNKCIQNLHGSFRVFAVVAGRKDVVREDSRSVGSLDARRRTHEAEDAHQGWSTIVPPYTVHKSALLVHVQLYVLALAHTTGEGATHVHVYLLPVVLSNVEVLNCTFW